MNTIIADLKNILKYSHLIDNSILLNAYKTDASKIEKKIPEAVVIIKHFSDVQRIIEYANKYKINIIVRGGGTSPVGGVVCDIDSIVIDLTNLDRIINFREEDRLIEVEAGVRTLVLQNYLKERGYMYPPDPSSSKVCTIGGNIATNAGGLRAIKYGVTLNWIAGLDIITGKGDIIRTNKFCIKSVAGFNLTSLFVGSEGTLGIILSCALKFIKYPLKILTYFVLFEHKQESIDFCENIIKQDPIPACLEWFDNKTFSLIKKTINHIDLKNKSCAVILEYHFEKDTLSLDYERFLKKYTMIKAEEQEERNLIWNIRKQISPSLAKLKKIKVNEDIRLPICNIKNYIDYSSNIEKEYNIDIINYGHYGDGNIHTNIMLDKTQMQKKQEILNKIFKKVEELNGSISGEHGIGLTKIDYIKYEYNTVLNRYYEQIKNIFDPNRILNRNKKIKFMEIEKNENKS